MSRNAPWNSQATPWLFVREEGAPKWTKQSTFAVWCHLARGTGLRTRHENDYNLRLTTR